MHAWLGLGSNVGERERHLSEALARLSSRGFGAVRRSALYLTEPVDAPPEHWFVNGAAGGETALSPAELLRACLEVEREMGRVREVYHGPRTVDLDVLLCDDLVLRTEDLVVPHPRLHERRFVLQPLCDIAPEVTHPVLGRTMAELLAECPDRSSVQAHRPAESWT
jgi:2-amino-4-hydroxy-6-hydroxymethyldihydropteridine diphosphokinase